MSKDVVAHRRAVVGGVVAAIAYMYLLAPVLLSDFTLQTAVNFWHAALILVLVLGGLLAGILTWFVLVHAFAWYLMDSNEYYFFSRWFFNID